MGSLLYSPEKMDSKKYLDHMSERIDQLRMLLKSAHPSSLALRTGADYRVNKSGAGEFALPLWGQEILVTYPEFMVLDAQTGEELPAYLQALLLYYFNTCDGTPLASQWISFSELPDGRFYNQAFQGYTGQKLSKVFQNELHSFELAAQNLGGQRELRATTISIGDAAYAFQVLPKVPILVVYWLGDEDFPASCQLLFDASVSHCLPTDACAIIGSTLTRRLIARGGG